uniref:3'-5' exonuclease domain-containing protein n=1 Tax=Angiostrongylus cantonensis TaxID=6313 RepID=A0A0K0CW94_ANGCA
MDCGEADDMQSISDSDLTLHFKLSELSEKLLGVKLDKSEQCSNWALRPLRISQKRYAAMDAYIVTQLFSKLKTTAEWVVFFHIVVYRQFLIKLLEFIMDIHAIST